MCHNSWLTRLQERGFSANTLLDKYLHPFTGTCECIRIFHGREYFCKVYLPAAGAILWTPHPYMYHFENRDDLAEVIDLRHKRHLEWPELAIRRGGVEAWTTCWGQWPEYYCLIPHLNSDECLNSDLVSQLLSAQSTFVAQHAGGGTEFHFSEGKCLLHLSPAQLFRDGHPFVMSVAKSEENSPRERLLSLMSRILDCGIVNAYGDSVG